MVLVRCLSGPFGDIDKEMLAKLAVEDLGVPQPVNTPSNLSRQLPCLGLPYQVKMKKGVIFKSFLI